MSEQDLRQQYSMVKLLVSALEENARAVPSRVNAKRAEMDAALATGWQGAAKQAFDQGANVMQQKVQEVASHVMRLSEGVHNAGVKVTASDADQTSAFKGAIANYLAG